MANLKHTSGPWRLSNDLMEVTISRVGILEGTKSIANIKDFGKTEEEWKANAKLIASAPDLLQKLQYMVDAWEDVRISGRKDIMETFTEYAKESIKKATE